MELKYVGAQVEYGFWEQLKATAKQLDLTIAQIVRRALIEWLERYTQQTDEGQGVTK